MKFVPREYQKLTIDHLLTHPSTAAWLSMGLGKTVSTLTAIAEWKKTDPRPVLVIAPLRVARSTWPDEVQKWDHLQHLRVSVIAGKNEKGRVLALLEDADIYTVNYEALPWLVDYLDGVWPFATVVADEATRLKGYRKYQGTKRARALAQVRPQIERFIELTGTPAPNGLLDLWGQMWFIDGGKRLGKAFKHYQESFFRPYRVGRDPYAVQWDPIEGADKMIMERVKDVVLKINAEDYFDISEPIFTNIEVELPSDIRREYDLLEKDFLLELDGGLVEASNAAVKTSKLLQLAGGALYDEKGETYYRHDAKLAALQSVVEEAGGAPVLVSYTFRFEAEAILAAFRKQAKLLDRNPQTIRDWNAGKIPILLAHPAACGHGLSLQDGGNILVFYSAGWNLEEYAQIIERIGPTRQKQSGHDRPVFVYHIVAKNTMDEVVLRRLRTKQSVLDCLLERRRNEAE